MMMECQDYGFHFNPEKSPESKSKELRLGLLHKRTGRSRRVSNGTSRCKCGRTISANIFACQDCLIKGVEEGITVGGDIRHMVLLSRLANGLRDGTEDVRRLVKERVDDITEIARRGVRSPRTTTVEILPGDSQ